MRGWFRAACPSYADRWNQYRSESHFEASLLYVHLGDFARHIVALLSAGDVGELAAVCAVIERLHLEGDAYVQEAATIGLLEGIQNVASHDETGLDPVVERLGPVSRSWWRGLEKFCSGEAPAVLPAPDVVNDRLTRRSPLSGKR